MRYILALGLLLASTISAGAEEEIGSVDTAFSLFGNHKIVIEVFDDPKVSGVSCYLSRAKTGGLTGKIGLAEDRSDASVACRQVNDISFTGHISQKEEVFTQKTSLIFKHMRVVRVVDPKRNVLTYLVYSDRLIDGSPKNSITAVPLPTGMKIPLK